MADLIGKTVSHYRILEKVGQGGMGIVYKAEDTKLKRTVALKFLPHHLLANEEDKTRFLHEAQAASALNHPNIMTIHEIDDIDEETFIAMEYVEGETLKDKVEKGPLKTKQLLNIAITVADGLNAAHEQEIVHRDIKSENIMISEAGMVKIMDFGLAKRKGMSRITKAGSTLGTLAYMSPEQAEGLEVDRRSDLFSFGVVLYEMATGQLPFWGEHDAAILYSIVNEEPLPVTTLNPNVPQELDRIIHKALEKNPERRYPDMKAMIEELKAASILGITIPKQEKSIVVLPFVNMSPDPDQEYFSDGLTEEIITDLSQVRELRVISRTSAMMLKGTRKAIGTIGRELNVRYVLEGSVRKAGNNLRITAQLIDVTNDTHIWADKYKGTLDDVFDIQEKVSRSIVDALKLKLSPEEDQKIAGRPIKNMQAYECYLRARQETWLFTKDALDRAVQYLQTGLDIIGDNPVLFAGMGYVYSQYVNIGVEHEEYVNKAEEYAEKALKLDPESSEAHLVLGFVHMTFGGNPKKGIHYFKQALASNPDDPHALMWLIVAQTCVGKTRDTGTLVKKLLQVDPLTPMSQGIQGLLDLVEGRLDSGLENIRKWFRMDPKNPAALFFYAQFLAYNQRLDDAVALVDENVHADWNDAFTKGSLFVKFAVEGDTKKIEELVTGEITKTWRRDLQFSYFLASLLALAGMKDAALNWLENAIDQGFINYPFISHHDPLLETIRGEDRFKNLLERAEYEWEHFEA